MKVTLLYTNYAYVEHEGKCLMAEFTSFSECTITVEKVRDLPYLKLSPAVKKALERAWCLQQRKVKYTDLG